MAETRRPALRHRPHPASPYWPSETIRGFIRRSRDSFLITLPVEWTDPFVEARKRRTLRGLFRSIMQWHVTTDVGELVTIGKVIKPFGIKGEVRVQSLTDVPGRWEQVAEVMLVPSSGPMWASKVRQVRFDGRGYIVAFDGVSSPEEAAAFRGAWVKIHRSEVPRPPGDQFYEFELIGLTVEDEEGRVLGKVVDVVETGAHHIVVVQGPLGEILVPATRGMIASVDLAAGTMVVRRVEGLGA